MNEADRTMLERAIETAVVSHAGQTDKNGEPYILHALRVMFGVHERRGSVAQQAADRSSISPPLPDWWVLRRPAQSIRRPKARFACSLKPRRFST